MKYHAWFRFFIENDVTEWKIAISDDDRGDTPHGIWTFRPGTGQLVARVGPTWIDGSFMQVSTLWKSIVACWLVSSIWWSGRAAAETIRLGLISGGEAIVQYELSVLRMALDFLPGNQTLEIVNMERTPQQRMLYILEHGLGHPGSNIEWPIDVVMIANSSDWEERFLQVDIPVTRGLLGSRVLVVRPDWNDRHTLPCDLSELTQTVTIGSGVDWPDSDVFEQAGFTVTRASHAGLWRMLRGGRFDGFNRSVEEVVAELEHFKATGWTFEIAPKLVFSYRQDYFFYVHPDNHDLHARLTVALEEAYASGAFMAHFRADPAIQSALSILRQPDLCRIHLESPFVTERLSAIPDRYWE